jgi:hypothetical protein
MGVTPAGHILLAFCVLLVILIVYVFVQIIHRPMINWIPATKTTAQKT